MKKIILTVVILIILLGAVSIILFGGSKCPGLVSNQKPDSGSLAMSIVPVFESDSFFKINAEYPQFGNVDPDFNKKITDLINGEISNFKKDSLANWDARKATATEANPVPETPAQPFDFIATWTPVQLNNQYLSFVLNIYYFTGGAHGLNEIYAYNYDFAKKKEITILDFFNSSQDSLNKVADLASKQITSQLQEKGVKIGTSLQEMIKQGTLPTAENYRNFNFSNSTLAIYFQQYQAAPGAYGSLIVTFYKDILDSNSLKSDYLK
jgi:hypothetical protein